MIINWNDNIIKSVSSHKLVNIFHASAIEKHLQKIYIIKYLRSLGYTDQDIKTWFVSLDNNDNDSLDHLINVSYKVLMPKNKDYTIVITSDELHFIDDLPYNYEFKSFLLASICVCKFMKIKKGYACFNTRYKSYAYFLATGEDNYNVNKQKHCNIEKYFRECLKKKILKLSTVNPKVRAPWGGSIQVSNVVLDGRWIDWDATDGVVITSEYQIKKICKKYLHEKTDICPQCGKSFVRSPHAKTLLCPDCYKIMRKRNKREEMAKLRKQEKS